MPAPTQVEILSFQVGFGDCFLLRFVYPGERSRHVLIDFGSFPKAPWLKGNGMREVAEAVRDACGGKLDAVIATHRHADHINGFTNDEDDPGSVIAGCEPDIVVQPWTEDPDARRDARKPTAAFMGAIGAADDVTRRLAFDRGVAFVDSLDQLRDLLPAVRGEAKRLALLGYADVGEQLSFHGENGLSNLSAVKNLMAMGQAGKAQYVFHGSDSGLEEFLPGVKTTVLGPPTLEQEDAIRKFAKTAPDQYWLTQTRTALRIAAGPPETKGYAERISSDDAPAYARWLITRLRSLRGRQLLELVRTLDGVLNNTSVILLFEVGSRKLLFPGDAQLENWTFALQQPGVQQALAGVDFYKVGHHGSLNATPKTMLWKNFTRRGAGLETMVSTLAGVHGGKQGKPTEVPRETLMTALRDESVLHTTEDLAQTAGAHGKVTIAV
jgi:hypothetical protein